MTDWEQEQAESIALALLVEENIGGMKATTVIFGMCWVLAAVILQGEEAKPVGTDRAADMIAEQIKKCVHLLKTRPKPGVH